VRRRSFLELAVTAPILLTATRLSGQTAYPSGPIELVIPFPPGGPTDAAPRIALDYLRPLLNNANLVPLNKPGAGGGVAVEYVARSRPDGYTVLATSNPPLSIRTAIEKKASYRLEDFAALGRFATDVGLMVARPTLGIKSIDELIEYARKSPDALTYGSAGPGTVTHVSTELFKRAADIKMVHVPFRGSGPAVQAILGGHVPLISTAYSSVRPMVENGDVVPLITTAARRLPALPNVPTLAEKGFGESGLNIWMGYYMPAATPQPMVQMFASAIAEASRNNEMNAAIERAGMQPDYGDAADTAALLQREHAIVTRLAQVVDLAG